MIPKSTSWSKSLGNYIFGFDFFISYAHADAQHYAVDLASRLDEQGFECFVDTEDYAAGDDWRAAGRLALRRTSRLIVVCTDAATRSEPVLSEVQAFRALNRRIIPINVAETLARGTDQPLLEAIGGETLWLSEPAESLARGPSDEVVTEIRRSFDLTRQHQRRQRGLSIATAVFALLAVAASGLGWQAYQARGEALRALEEAERENRRVRASELAARSDETRTRYPQRSILLAVEALHATEQDGVRVRSAEQALRDALGRDGPKALYGPGARFAHVEITADSRTLLGRLDDGSLWVWDLTTPDPRTSGVPLAGRVVSPAAVALSKDGTRLVAGGDDGTLRWWNLGGEAIREPGETHAYESSITSVVIDAQGSLIASAGTGELQLHHLGSPASSRQLDWLGAASPMTHLFLTDDSSTLLAVTEDETWLYRLGEDASLPVRVLDEDEVVEARFGFQNRWLVVRTISGNVWQLDLESEDIAGSAVFLGDTDVIAFDENRLRVAIPNQGRLVMRDVSTNEFPKNNMLWIWGGLEEDPWDDIMEPTFSADGRFLAAVLGSFDWRMWDVSGPTIDDPSEVYGSYGVRQHALSADGQLLALIGEAGIRVVDFSKERASRDDVLSGTQNTVSLALDPQGRWLIAAGGDDTATLWNLRPEDRRFKGAPRAIPLLGHEGRARQTVMSADRRWISIRSDTGAALLWDLHRDVGQRSMTIGASGTSEAVMSADGRWLTVADSGRAYRYDLHTPLPFEREQMLGDPKLRWSVTVSKDGYWMLSRQRDETVRLWDLRGENPVDANHVLTGLPRAIGDIDITAHGDWLLMQDDRRRAWLYRFQSEGGEQPVIPVLEDMDLWETLVDPDGDWLVAHTRRDGNYVWDLNDPDAEDNTWELNEDMNDWITEVAMTPDGRWLLAGYESGAISRWDLEADDPVQTAADLRGHTGRIRWITTALSERWIISASEDGSSRFWERNASEPATSAFVAQDDSTVLNLSPDSRWAVVRNDDGTRLVDLDEPDREGASATLSPGDVPVYNARFSKNSRWLITLDKDDVATLLDLHAANPLQSARTLRGHEEGVRQVLLTADGERLVTIGEGFNDHTPRLWDLTAADPTRTSVLLAGHRDRIRSATVSADSVWLLTKSDDDTVSLWPLKHQPLFELARRTAGRNFTPEEWEPYFSGQAYRKTFDVLPGTVPAQAGLDRTGLIPE